MELAFFVYTILILLISSLSAAIALSAFIVSKKRVFLYAMAFFVFYFCDVALIFQFEYLGQNINFSEFDFYAIDYAFLKIGIAAGSLESILLIFYEYLEERRLFLKVIPAALFVLSCSAIVLFMPEGGFRQWMFYITRQLFLMWCFLFAAYKYFSSKDKFFRKGLLRYKKFYWISFFLVLASLVEDTFTMLVWTPGSDYTLSMLYLSQRNFCENILLFLVAGVTIRAAVNMFRTRAHETTFPPDNPMAHAHIDALLPQFCSRYKLTKREAEILVLILEGKNTQDIAEALFLVPGTVKTHVHNIIHKTGHETRQDLVNDFWRL